MLITDKLVYFELPKTGCTHTRGILKNIPNDYIKTIGIHNTYDSVPGTILGDFKSKTKVGNIRNPWDWYVSLWAYGCMKKGGLYFRVTQNPNIFSFAGLKSIVVRIFRKERIFSDLNRWDNVYSDSANAHNFRSWLKMILLEKNISIGEDYKENIISAEIGFLTYRYIMLYTYNGKKMIGKFRNLSSLFKHDAENNFLDVIIRNESINDDLLENVRELDCDEVTLNDIFKRFQKKRNRSIRKDYKEYYDEETQALVAEKDKLIIEKYHYSF